MIERIRQSLANKIIFSSILGMLFLLITIFTVLTTVATDALKQSEKEKAELIADIYAPLLSINIFLGFNTKIDTLSQQLIDNNNIVSVKIYADNQLIKNLASENLNDNTFFISKKIMHPNLDIQLGRLEILYSSQHYQETLHAYTSFIMQSLIFLIFLFLMFSIYIKKLLSPLKQMRQILQNYKPEDKHLFTHTKRDDEIGLISSSFNIMQLKILNYAQQQKNINKKLESKVSEKTEELRHQLYFDELTNLPNRKSLIQSIIRLESAVLLIINIDDFKEINDFFGHHAGDRLLKKFKRRVQIYLDDYPNIKFYHLRGDEFSILYDVAISKEELEKHSLKLIRMIEQMQFVLEDHDIRIRVSIGATLDMVDPIEKVDMALKKARELKVPYLLYDESHSIKKRYKENLEWATKVKNAITDDRIIPFYQPIFNNKTGKIISYEALIRLKESDGKIISPFQFLEIAKKVRLYHELTKIMIEKSCQHFSTLSTSFSINLTFNDMTNPDIISFIKERIKHYGVAKRIIFEILESEDIDSYEKIASFIQEMHTLGCKIAIDDFGSGYSNYEHLLKLHIDFIKIDGSLIKDIDTDSNAQIIVQTILDFAQKLGIETIAEYVHNKAVYNHVKKLNIDRFQGFFLGEPKERTL